MSYKITDYIFSFSFRTFSAMSGIGGFPSPTQHLTLNQNLVPPPVNMPKMGLSALGPTFQNPLMSTPKTEQQSEMYGGENIFNLEQGAGVPPPKPAETQVFKNIPSKAQVHRCTILNDLLKKPIEQDDCVVMQKYLSNFGNRQAFRTTIVKGPDSFFYCIGKHLHFDMPSDPAQVSAAARSGLTKYIADNKEYCEVSFTFVT